jgi:hypothetical protein
VLLNSNTHAPSGLMRADWTRHELHRNDVDAWHFLATEAAQVRSSALARSSLAERAAQLIGN